MDVIEAERYGKEENGSRETGESGSRPLSPCVKEQPCNDSKLKIIDIEFDHSNELKRTDSKASSISLGAKLKELFDQRTSREHLENVQIQANN